MLDCRSQLLQVLMKVDVQCRIFHFVNLGCIWRFITFREIFIIYTSKTKHIEILPCKYVSPLGNNSHLVSKVYTHSSNDVVCIVVAGFYLKSFGGYFGFVWMDLSGLLFCTWYFDWWVWMVSFMAGCWGFNFWGL
jgi:hypothetical protein